MPNHKAHLITSLALGFIAGLLLYNELTYSVIFGLLSGVTASTPDRIEKPTSSLHRGFFHSITLFVFLIILMFFIVQNPLSGLVFGYITHLLLDYARTSHKPII